MSDKKIKGFKQSVKEFFSSKSNWTAIIGVVSAVAGYVSGEFTLSASVQLGLGSFATLFIRDAIAGTNQDSI